MLIHRLSSLLVRALLLRNALAQDLQSNISANEAAALKQIVEDVPEDIFTIAKDWLSPEYSLIYKVPLPIPPVKQPLKYVSTRTTRQYL